MHSAHLPTVEIHDLAAWDEHFAVTKNLSGWVVQSVDLTGRAEDLNQATLLGTVFLGCNFPNGLKKSLREKGALIFPQLPNLTFNPYRAALYEATELYDTVASGGSYAACRDAQIYSWAKAQVIPPPLTSGLAMSLHDHAISDALDEFLGEADANRTVGVMGGHAMRRGTDEYHEAAKLGATLAGGGHTVLTGGGPGAMEAANLGAYFAHLGPDLDKAVEYLATSPLFSQQPTTWVRTALEVRQLYDGGTRSIGVPTWYYGHEPANVFATGIAKYFSNAVREDTLLERCHGGLVYLPGAAGTIQEVFQATTRNYYANDPEVITPMVFLGTRYWTKKFPVWPLLASMAKDRLMDERLLLSDDIAEATRWLGQWS